MTEFWVIVDNTNWIIDGTNGLSETGAWKAFLPNRSDGQFFRDYDYYKLLGYRAVKAKVE